MSETNVVTCFLRNRGEALLSKRSEDVGSCSGKWGAVAGHAEGDPDAAVREAIRVETGLNDAVSFVRAGEPFAVEDGDTRWVVHSYLFDRKSRTIEPTDGTTEFEWASPTEIRRRETVPDLWKSYECVAPTVDTVRKDTDHGSAWLSVRALEILRDRAGVLATGREAEHEDEWGDLTALAGDLRAARPSMTSLENRINRAMADATDDRTATALERAAIAGIERAFAVDAAAANEAAALLNGPIVTLSRSGTVLDALRQVNEPVVVAESRPAREGVGVAEALADDRSVTLITDAAVAHVLSTRSIACALVGADTVLPDGSVLNKVGTRGIAIAAAHEDIPVYAVAASDKISAGYGTDFEKGDSGAVYNGIEGVEVANPTFDRTPSELVTVVTEDGPLDGESIIDRAEAFAALAARTQEPSPDPE